MSTTHRILSKAALALVIAALPLAALAQQPEPDKRKPPAAARPAAPPPAARPAPPAARPAPPPMARPAPPPMARPQPPAIRQAPPQMSRPQPPANRPPPNFARPQAPQRVAPQQANRPQRPAAQNAAPSANPRIINRAERRNAPNAPAAQPNAPAVQRAAPTAAQQRATARQEQVERRREQRVLRNLPPAQRAARRQQFEQARQQRAAQRQQQAQPQAVQPNARVNAAAATSAQPQLRRNGQPRITPQASRQGRFAGAFAGRQGTIAASAAAAVGAARWQRTAPRQAWRTGRRANFVAWYGPVFWPYAYSDIFEYTFFPSGYDDGYWYYAYDDFFDGVYYGEYGPPADYVGAVEASPPRASSQPLTYKSVQSLCQQPGNGITAWPIAEIETKVGLNADQKALLGNVQNAGKRAADVFRQTCPSENAYPLTPPGRLASMTARLDATLQAVETVRPPLATFYDSLNDEQKERFNAIGPGKNVANAETKEALPDDARKCGENKSGLTNLPIEQIEDAVKPTEQQQASLDRLGEATVKAVGILQAACPSETPITPPGRLEAIETRLKAMVDAANTVKQPLGDFYAGLTAEQKARFNRMGRDLTVGQAAQ
ncbi:MAG TPA: Spy/CpxP family protein refolding chaperone [Pseudolabrys sp.]|nr:Spy/CpxP family protein refolding chaperone [Pseudolabrys sp.]